jgi:hypothetical protein
VTIQDPEATDRPGVSAGDGAAGAVSSQPAAPPSPIAVAPRPAAYHPPPPFPPPGLGSNARLDERAGASLALAILGIAFGLPLGLPGLILGPIAYFLSKSALERIEASQGTLKGHNAAVTGRILAIAATAVGALVSLVWVILILMALSTSG